MMTLTDIGVPNTGYEFDCWSDKGVRIGNRSLDFENPALKRRTFRTNDVAFEVKEVVIYNFDVVDGLFLSALLVLHQLSLDTTLS